MTKSDTPIQDIEDEYRARQYQLLPKTGSGNSVLIHPNRHAAVKINVSKLDKEFADFCKLNPNLAVPEIYSHEPRPGVQSVVVMECLSPIDSEEAEQLSTWYSEYVDFKAGKSPRPSDTLGIIDTVEALWTRMECLLDQDSGISGLDIQPKNLMKDKNGRYKIIDGFY